MHPTIEMSYGKLEGREVDGVQIFKGIPFAAPPLAELRWKPPQKPKPWSGTRDSTEFGPCAIQSTIPGDVGELIGIATHETSEDCLYLNVWAPAKAEGKKLPVMLWIHGGGNTVGAGSQPRVNGEHLARVGEVVVVTCNYRLGILGFMFAPELGAPGNQALLDQIEALTWVRDEIESFGGDPNNVTLFGQSAGGFDIAQLMGMPAAHGLFAKAVPMSGSLRNPQTPEAAAKATEKLSAMFGGIDQLRNVKAKDLLAVQLNTAELSFPVAPVVDGTYIKDDPEKVMAEGLYTKDMPILIGICRDESTLFVKFNPANQSLTEEDLLAILRSTFEDKAQEVLDTYKEERKSAGLPTLPVDILSARGTDSMFRMPAIRTAEAHLKHSENVWMYRFDHESPAHDGMLQACHSLDIPFVWGTYGLPAMQRFCGTGEDIARISSAIMKTYLAFAHTGNPKSDAFSEWPTYSTKGRQTVLLNREFEVAEAPLDNVRQFYF